MNLFSINNFLLAQGNTLNIPRPPQVGPGWDNLGKIIAAMIGIILIISSIASFLYLLWGGLQWILSGGDKAGVEAAQHKIQASLIGLLIVFASWALFGVVGKLLGIDVFNLIIPSPATL
ncbi:hypothetical protein HY029_03035 [Candidatus Gottesmanbacteria bacterium]|nr:hypothetical protein [Candidatus Gottesmanbacteria bacterium]